MTAKAIHNAIKYRRHLFFNRSCNEEVQKGMIVMLRSSRVAHSHVSNLINNTEGLGRASIQPCLDQQLV